MSRRRRLARIRVWERYIDRAHRLYERQTALVRSTSWPGCSGDLSAGYRIVPGVYRAYGWRTGARDVMRHGS